MTETLLIDPLLRALADPTRLRIMRLLSAMELAVGELAQVLGQSQPRVSRHVKILCDAALAQRRKEGSWVFLKSAIGETVPSALGAATARLLAAAEYDDAGFAAECAEDRRQLAAIRAAREAAAAAYFARHAEEWDQIRSLLSPDGSVEQALDVALGDDLGAMLDIGTGTGRMAELFAPRARHITALDKSPDMLRIARSRLQHLPGGQVDLVQGDFTSLPCVAGTFDTILLHQVLHYAQAPEAVLAEAARVARAGARIAIVDLDAHGHEELRSVHAHARLGFSDAQMGEWFAQAGFAAEPSIALSGGQLTVKIWTGRRLGAGAAPSLSTPEAVTP
ncbi:methyltransferase domain-containing protein [Novosphingobium umbonatum]|uniref:Methyltransferase domain-containing protein n=1 Tax=Novosphingobium umbonatum TaxID=1908524 RepID=A0A437N4V4_9SPHN|nr:metalloregulator ArsR/SmtB family transcription factor [Novosphingobium umbonatum]RVU04950.1 methyltransferase domain-containing protein [Novosphingobium umbonatum]